MFQFRRFPAYAYLIQRTLTEYCSAGFPHSEICGSKLMCSSPQLIAACHVLRRLLMPRHSPCALSSLTFSDLRCLAAARSALVIMNYAGIHRSSFGSCCYPSLEQLSPFYLFHNILLLALCCLLFHRLSYTLFSFQGAAPGLFQGQIEMLGPLPKHFNPILVEVTGLEPVTPCLQSRCSTS